MLESGREYLATVVRKVIDKCLSAGSGVPPSLLFLRRAHVLFVVKCLPDKDIYRVVVCVCRALVVLAHVHGLLLGPWMALQLVVSFYDVPMAYLVTGEKLRLSCPIRQTAGAKYS